MNFDPLYIIFSFPALLVGLLSSHIVSSTYRKYSNSLNARGINGVDTVYTISKAKNYQVIFEEGNNDLNNHYNPITSTILLSSEVSRTPSIASVAIAAHETGHLSQHIEGTLAIRIRSFVAPIVGITTNTGYALLIIGIILSLGQISWLGITLFSSATVFSFLTLPVELDASKRALKFIREFSLLDGVEIEKAKEVLNAAAFTYVAATVQSLSTLLYFFLRVKGTSRR
ncbi:zinc metallopeptidase [Candidatus Dojkabacteria bacterium]|nr:zinc metallopeptidase [Candidatus Dojkabacteria bacterium]